MVYSNEKRNKGITLIALIITIIVLLILAGVTIAMLTGGDSAPAKANEAKQKNDIGTAQDQIAILVENARLEAYDDIYVNNNASVSSSNAVTTVGQRVIDDLLDIYGTEQTMGCATILVEQTSSGQNATVTISTRDFEEEGIIRINGGTLSWGALGGGSGTYTAYSIGDEVTVGTGANAQEFYVLEASDETQSTVTLLAKYNLSNLAETTGDFKDHYLQAPNAILGDEPCRFSNTYYWGNAWNTWNSGSKETMLNLNNEPIPTTGENAETVSTNVILKARDYATAVGGTNGRLLTYEEVNSLKTSYSDMIWGPANTGGTFSGYLFYWLGSAHSGVGNYVWTVNGTDKSVFGYPIGDYDSTGGRWVRPVITISKFLIQ